VGPERRDDHEDGGQNSVGQAVQGEQGGRGPVIGVGVRPVQTLGRLTTVTSAAARRSGGAVGPTPQRATEARRHPTSWRTWRQVRDRPYGCGRRGFRSASGTSSAPEVAGSRKRGGGSWPRVGTHATTHPWCSVPATGWGRWWLTTYRGAVRKDDLPPDRRRLSGPGGGAVRLPGGLVSSARARRRAHAALSPESRLGSRIRRPLALDCWRGPRAHRRVSNSSTTTPNGSVAARTPPASSTSTTPPATAPGDGAPGGLRQPGEGVTPLRPQPGAAGVLGERRVQGSEDPCPAGARGAGPGPSRPAGAGPAIR
jgi:hypothetical protein